MSIELNFNLSATDIEASSLPPILSKPCIANAKLISVIVEDIKGAVGEETYDVIDMNFAIQDGELKGYEFRHRIFGFKPYPDSAEPEKDQDKWGKHLTYVLGYFITKKNALAIINADNNDWDKIRSNVKRAFEAESLQGWKTKIVKIKIMGYITGKGKAVLGFPRYLGFISDAESEHQVTFSRRELTQNAGYLAAYQREISATNSESLNNVSGGGAEAVENNIDF